MYRSSRKGRKNGDRTTLPVHGVPTGVPVLSSVIVVTDLVKVRASPTVKTSPRFAYNRGRYLVPYLFLSSTVYSQAAVDCTVP